MNLKLLLTPAIIGVLLFGFTDSAFADDVDELKSDMAPLIEVEKKLTVELDVVIAESKKSDDSMKTHIANRNLQVSELGKTTDKIKITDLRLMIVNIDNHIDSVKQQQNKQVDELDNWKKKLKVTQSEIKELKKEIKVAEKNSPDSEESVVNQDKVIQKVNVQPSSMSAMCKYQVNLWLESKTNLTKKQSTSLKNVELIKLKWTS